MEEISQDFRVRGMVQQVLAESRISQDRIEITVQRFLEQERQNPVAGVSETTVGSSPDPVSRFLPGVITMFVLFAGTLTARALVEERKKGTLERLLTTRLSTGQLFYGKFLYGASRGFIQTFILMVLAYIVFQLFTPISFAEVLIIALAFSTAVSALGLLLGSIARTEDQAVWISVFFTMVTVMFSGTFFHISEGSVLYTLSQASINTYANDAFSTIMSQGGSLADVTKELVILGGVAVLGLVFSRILFRVASEGR